MCHNFCVQSTSFCALSLALFFHLKNGNPVVEENERLLFENEDLTLIVNDPVEEQDQDRISIHSGQTNTQSRKGLIQNDKQKAGRAGNLDPMKKAGSDVDNRKQSSNIS